MYREPQVYKHFVKMLDGTEHFFVSFDDWNGQTVEIEVSRELNEEIKAMRRDDERQWMEQRRHYEHLELSDINIEKRSVNQPISVEKITEKSEAIEALEKAFLQLSETQKYRILLRFRDGLSFAQIAQKEMCSKESARRSVVAGVEQLKKYLKLFSD